MTEWSQPWDGVAAGDAAARAPYSATEWDDMFESLFGSLADCGVLPGIGLELAVSGIASPVSVATGAALVRGKFFRSVSAKSLTIPSPSGATRTDYIVLRSCWGSVGTCGLATYYGSGEIGGPQKIRICHKENPDEGTGFPPALEQTDGIIWEIPLAVINVTVGGVITVTDARQFVYGPAVDEFFGVQDFVEYGVTPPGWHAPFWYFDPDTDETLFWSWRIPDQYRQESFRIWVYFLSSGVPEVNKQVVWMVYGNCAECGEIFDGATFMLQGTGIAPDNGSELACVELTDPGIGVHPVGQCEHDEKVAFHVMRYATSPNDNYLHDALLVGVRIKLY